MISSDFTTLLLVVVSPPTTTTSVVDVSPVVVVVVTADIVFKSSLLPNTSLKSLLFLPSAKVPL